MLLIKYTPLKINKLKIILCLGVYFTLLICKGYAQKSLVYLNNNQAKELTECLLKGKLVVVIDNEKSELDAALIDAVKLFWKKNEVIYLSSLEFNIKYKAKSFDKNNLYLFNNYNQIIQIYPYATNKTPVASKAGYYLTNDPNKLLWSLTSKDAPPYLFFSSKNFSDYGASNYHGFFYLMVKYFNHETDVMNDFTNLNTSKKFIKEKNILFLGNKSDLKTKVVLLYKEQMGKSNKTKSKNSNKAYLKEFSSTHVVFPEDIEYALKNAKQEIMIYNDGVMYSAFDGSAVLMEENNSGPNLAIVGTIVSVVVIVSVIATMASLLK